MSADLEENLRNGSVIPLKAIVTNRGGPSMSREFNRYYLHWWTLTYFVFESPRYRDHARALVQRGGQLDAFNQLFGPLAQVQTDWHTFVLKLKDGLSGKDLEFWKQHNAMTEDSRGVEGTLAGPVPGMLYLVESQ